MPKVVAPRNHKTKRDLARQWRAAHQEARQNRATRVEDDAGGKAKYRWLRLIARSNLESTSRLLAHTLCLHGRVNGDNIHPSTRTLAAESGLSERSVCTHLDNLVRSGWLWRSSKELHGGKNWAMTIYTLCAPEAVLDGEPASTAPWEEDPTWTPDAGIRGAEPPSAPDTLNGHGTEPPSVPIASSDVTGAVGAEGDTEGTERGAQGAETGADGAERRSDMVLNVLQSSSSSKSLTGVSQYSSSRERALARTAVTETVSEKAEVETEKLERTRAFIVDLLQKGFRPAEIPRLMHASGVTLEEVQQVQQQWRNSIPL